MGMEGIEGQCSSKGMAGDARRGVAAGSLAARRHGERRSRAAWGRGSCAREEAT